MHQKALTYESDLVYNVIVVLISISDYTGEVIMSDTNSGSFKEKLATKAGKFAGSRFVRAIMDAGYSVISFSIIGAIFLILTVLPQAFPIPGFASWYANTVGRFTNLFQVVYNSTMGILALIFAGTFAYSYAKIYQQEEKLILCQ